MSHPECVLVIELHAGPMTVRYPLPHRLVCSSIALLCDDLLSLLKGMAMQLMQEPVSPHQHRLRQTPLTSALRLYKVTNLAIVSPMTKET